jgi:hypothetical protein
MSLFGLNPNANSNFPDRFRRRPLILATRELSRESSAPPLEIPTVRPRLEYEAPRAAADPPGGGVYASKFKAGLNNLMSATPWEEDSGEPAATAAPGEGTPADEFGGKDDFVGHLVALLASARSGDVTAAKTAAMALRTELCDSGGVAPFPDSPGAFSPNRVFDDLQSLIQAASSGDIDVARRALRNLARDLASALGNGATPTALTERDAVVEIPRPGPGAAYETLMEFTRNSVATAA